MICASHGCRSLLHTSGIHNAGSYGTRGIVTAAGGQYINPLSLVVDHNRTGWVGPYGGDFFFPDIPVEGSPTIQSMMSSLHLPIILQYFATW